MIVLETLGQLVWRFKDWSRRPQEHETLYLSMFLSFPGGHGAHRCGSKLLRGELHMIVLEGLGELLEVLGGSRSGQEGSMSTKYCTCQRFWSSQEAASSPRPAPRMLRASSVPAPSRHRGMPPEASRARL